MEHDEITEKITSLRQDATAWQVGCAYKVYNTIGFGFLESVYAEGPPLEEEVLTDRTARGGPDSRGSETYFLCRNVILPLERS